MLISHTHRLVCFSNPKTGSESLRLFLSPLSELEIFPYRQRHRSLGFYPHVAPFEAARLFEEQGWDFASYRKISFVRDPFARLVSLYQMIGRVDRLTRLCQGLPLGQRNFSRWVHGISLDGRGGGGWPHQRWRRFGTYAYRHWAPVVNGVNSVDFTIRLEDVATEVPALIKALDLPLEGTFPFENRGGLANLAAYYDPELCGYVADLYADDLAKFKYSTPLLSTA